jgi:acyl-coenzyme A thioesterase PaaI-like protein
MFPEGKHSNLLNAVHGGTLLGFIDLALFAACYHLEALNAGPSVTLDLSTQFIAPGRIDQPLDAEIEVLRSTKRLVFIRGLLVQESDAAKNLVASFTATIRKAA